MYRGIWGPQLYLLSFYFVIFWSEGYLVAQGVLQVAEVDEEGYQLEEDNHQEKLDGVFPVLLLHRFYSLSFVLVEENRPPEIEDPLRCETEDDDPDVDLDLELEMVYTYIIKESSLVLSAHPPYESQTRYCSQKQDKHCLEPTCKTIGHVHMMISKEYLQQDHPRVEEKHQVDQIEDEFLPKVVCHQLDADLHPEKIEAECGLGNREVSEVVGSQVQVDWDEVVQLVIGPENPGEAIKEVHHPREEVQRQQQQYAVVK